MQEAAPLLLPDKCSIKDKHGDCPNPPSYIVSIMHDSGEYMVGFVCEEHKGGMERHLNKMQENSKLPKGSIKFVRLRPVGTDCVANYTRTYAKKLRKEVDLKKIIEEEVAERLD